MKMNCVNSVATTHQHYFILRVDDNKNVFTSPPHAHSKNIIGEVR